MVAIVTRMPTTSAVLEWDARLVAVTAEPTAQPAAHRLHPNLAPALNPTAIPAIQMKHGSPMINHGTNPLGVTDPANAPKTTVIARLERANHLMCGLIVATMRAPSEPSCIDAIPVWRLRLP